MKLCVQAIDKIADDVVRLLLAAADGSALPPCRPGAHLKFRVPIGAAVETREYSIVRRAPDGAFYEVAVLLSPGGRGGSSAMHALTVGSVLEAQGPFHAFELDPAAQEHLLIAGGIGVTPMLSMAEALGRQGASYEFHYAAKARSRMAYRDEIERLPGAVLYGREEARARLPLPALLRYTGPHRHVYVCGPASLIADVVETARLQGWPPGQVHFETFGGAVALGGDKPIRLELRASGKTITVGPQETILDAMLQAGLDPLHDCRRGECGMCMVPVLEGTPDHRDQALTAAEKASGKVICTCVSRALGDTLVLDF